MTEYYSEKVSVCVSMWVREEGHAGILLGGATTAVSS